MLKISKTLNQANKPDCSRIEDTAGKPGGVFYLPDDRARFQVALIWFKGYLKLTATIGIVIPSYQVTSSARLQAIQKWPGETKRQEGIYSRYRIQKPGLTLMHNNKIRAHSVWCGTHAIQSDNMVCSSPPTPCPAKGYLKF